jgi:hypothetical protein
VHASAYGTEHADTHWHAVQPEVTRCSCLQAACVQGLCTTQPGTAYSNCMTGQRIKTGFDIYPGFLCSSTYALVRVCCWLLCCLCGVTARIGLVEPATGCMVCLTVSVHADRHAHVHWHILRLGLLLLSYSYSSLGAYPVTTACTGFVQHLMASRYTTHGMSAVRHSSIMRYNVLNNSCRKLAADCLHAVMLLRPAQGLACTGLLHHATRAKFNNRHTLSCVQTCTSLSCKLNW